MIKQFFDQTNEIDKIIKGGATPANAEKLALLTKEDNLYTYALRNISTHDWLPHLRDKGLFQLPPSPIISKTHMQFPFWEGSQYLLRVVETAPHEVLNIVLKLPNTDNERVHEDFTQAACKMPPELAAKWAEKEIEWLKDQTILHLNLPLYLGDLVSYLAEKGKPSKALKLAKVLLALQRDPQYEQKMKEEQQEKEKDEEFVLLYYPEPHAKFNSWEYEKILQKNIPALVETAGIDAIKWLSQLLSTAMRLTRRHDEEAIEPARDYSYIWRPAVEEHEQNHKHDLKDAIIDAVRDAAEQMAKEPKNIDWILDILGDEKTLPWSIFRRLSLHLIRIAPVIDPALVKKYLLDKELFEDHNLHHEYWLLANERLGSLTNEEQAQIIRWVTDQEASELLDFRTRFEEHEGKPPTDAEENKFIATWLRNKLALIEQYLPADLKKRYNDAEAEVGPAKHPDFISYSDSGWVGPTSPKEPGQIAKMSIDRLIKYLTDEWEPPGGWDSPTRDGLARTIASAVGRDPDKYANACELYKSLHPTYIRGFIEGFHEAAKENRRFPWEPVLNLCRNVVDRPRKFSLIILRSAVGDDREETNWGWTRKRIANLIEEGLKKDRDVTIPYEKQETVWHIIKTLTCDPEPSVKSEQQMIQPFDAATMSINTVRGEAMHAMMYYVMWVRENIRKQKGEQELVRGFALMPNVQHILEKRLDRRREKTLTIRSVYGRWYPFLVAWDENWAKSYKRKVFPPGVKAKKHWDVAWGTHVVYNRPYDNVFKILRNEYREALNRLGQISIELAGARPPDESLAEHIITFYWRGLIHRRKNSLLDQFFNIANSVLRGHAMGFIGRSLAETPENVPAKIMKRFERLWAWRMNLARASDKPDKYEPELVAFGKWLASGKLEPRWAISQLLAVLRLVGRIDADGKMVEQLATLATLYPKDVTECFRIMVEGVSDGYIMWSWKEPGKELLRTVINGDDREAKEAAIDLVHRLGAMGHMEFRDLLQE
jgi:hypothetical protein